MEQRPVHPRRSSRALLGGLGVVAALALWGCSGGGGPSAPPPARPARPQAAKPAAPAPVVAAPAPTPYAYEAKDRRDPFRPLIAPKVVVAPTKAKPRTGPSVDEIKLTGIIWDRRSAYALVEAPNGAGYVLRVNDTIGEDARVAKITPDVVTIEVKPTVAAPNMPPRQVQLRLRKEE